MNILLLGSGGREHAFAAKIAKSSHCKQLYTAPGNYGTSLHGLNVAIQPTQFDQLIAFCYQSKIDMVVVGNEEPLVNGIVDYFLAQQCNIPIIGPSANGARLEGSKAFAKQFMIANHIPTATYQTFTTHTLPQAIQYITEHPLPIVLKADGLAAGKGVVICTTHEEAISEIQQMLTQGKFGQAGATVVVEQFLAGIEMSVFVLTDGTQYQILPTAKDYKKIGLADSGLNTGGMGAISPVPFATTALMNTIEQTVIKPTIQGLQSLNCTYHGFIYFGLIIVNNLPYLIEYNCRMGDPETQAVLPRITSDLLQHFIDLKNNKLLLHPIQIDQQSAATVVLASQGYPLAFDTQFEISNLSTQQNQQLFFAGTHIVNQALLTNGGRVLAATAVAPTLAEALISANSLAQQIQYKNKYFRTDIGFEFIN
jgi:phosphoribosylamine--glycine ligase